MELVRDSQRHARRTARSAWLGYLGRAGLAAQGVCFVSAVVIVYWALSRRFKESLAIDEMDAGTERLVTGLGVLGLCALAVVLGVVGWFLLKAALEFDPSAPVGIGGALSKLAHAT